MVSTGTVVQWQKVLNCTSFGLRAGIYCMHGLGRRFRCLEAERPASPRTLTGITAQDVGGGQPQ